MILSKRKNAFTLIELLTVIGIIGILAALVIISLGAAVGKARDATRQVDLKAITTALEQYRIDNNIYPISTSILLTGVDALGNLLVPNYIKNMPVDKFGNGYWYYSMDGTSYSLQTNSLAKPDTSISFSPNGMTTSNIACPIAVGKELAAYVEGSKLRIIPPQIFDGANKGSYSISRTPSGGPDSSTVINGVAVLDVEPYSPLYSNIKASVKGLNSSCGSFEINNFTPTTNTFSGLSSNWVNFYFNSTDRLVVYWNSAKTNYKYLIDYSTDPAFTTYKTAYLATTYSGGAYWSSVRVEDVDISKLYYTRIKAINQSNQLSDSYLINTVGPPGVASFAPINQPGPTFSTAPTLTSSSQTISLPAVADHCTNGCHLWEYIYNITTANNDQVYATAGEWLTPVTLPTGTLTNGSKYNISVIAYDDNGNYVENVWKNITAN